MARKIKQVILFSTYIITHRSKNYENVSVKNINTLKKKKKKQLKSNS